MPSLSIRTAIFATVMGLLAGCAAPGGGTGSNPDYDKANAQKKAVKMTQTARGAQLTADDRVLFDTGKSEIKPESQVFIDRVAQMLKEKTKADVIIEGHTDNQGTAALNQKLSEARAAAVRQGLVKSGIAATRIKSSGLGFTKPVADNATPEGRQENRRTEIVVLGESVEKLGGVAMADSLAAGLDRFLNNAGAFIKGVFGSEKKSN